MLLRDWTEELIIGLVGSLVANALYDTFRYLYRREIISRISVSSVVKLRRLIQQTKLFSRLMIRTAKTVAVSIHTHSQVLRDSIFRNNFHSIRAHLQDCLWPVRTYQFPRAIRVAASVSLMIIVTLSLLVISEDRQTPYSQLPDVEIAGNTKEQLRALIENPDVRGSGDDLNVSLWIRDNGVLYQFRTSDNRATGVWFPDDQKSIIGCAFANPNHVVSRYDANAEIIVSSHTGEPIGDRCEFRETEQRAITSIVCDSYNPTTNPEYTVGVCVYTEGKLDTTANGSLEVVRKSTQDFYRAVIPFLQTKKPPLVAKA